MVEVTLDMGLMNVAGRKEDPRQRCAVVISSISLGGRHRPKDMLVLARLL